MPSSIPEPVKTFNWKNILFISANILLSLAAILSIFRHGIQGSSLFLLVFYTIATGMAVTVGYHRLFAHATYRAHPLIRFLMLFFGAAAFEQSALKWASQHRDHHLYLDTERDPYSIKKGFFHAHMGWLFFWKQHTDYDNVKDLRQDPVIVHQHRYYILWAIGSGILLPLVIGYAAGDVWGALLIGVGLRITLVYQSTFCINSVCHKLGKATYDNRTTARDHWFAAFLTYGEGYHNFHHRFPSDYRNGVRWYHWDPSKWMIRLMALAGLAKDLRTVPYLRIERARIITQKDNALNALLKGAHRPFAVQIREKIESMYRQLHTRLSELEGAMARYHQLKQARKSPNEKMSLEELRNAALAELRVRQAAFKASFERWRALFRSKSSLMHAVSGT